ncbi:MAG: type II toxin-antitoxin system VapC family toxin [Verrucomicrobia bacterium]|nr:type II toxin-antitoxin system VapC family toxin [Verrucomicrobiota bacterium]
MKLLLDTHAVLWWLDDHPRLSAAAREAIADPANECWLSAISVFEIETKHRLGKLSLPAALTHGWADTVRLENWSLLPVSVPHATWAGKHPSAHGDPFDRILAAQAELDGLTLVTVDPIFADFATPTLW